ncbi:MAG TPA: hypothetical protein VH661_09420 [Candidatus Dormibacteraeota bacterium]|nr:hypothetical protein [Candidatus Dormibacteraeota bacterium]
MEQPGRGIFSWLPPALRRLEHRLGAKRDDRTLWVWVVPAATVVVTFVILAFIGMQGKVDLFLTVPMALTLSVFLGSLSAFYLTAASSDENEGDDDDRWPGPAAPQGPSPMSAPRGVVPQPRRPSPDPKAEERAPVGAGSGRR